MSELKLEGKLIKVFETNQISEKFKKREFVIETDEQYPQTVKFQLVQDSCKLIDNYKLGDMLNVYFNLRGRVWVNKNNEEVYFNTEQAWRIEKTGTTEEPNAFISADEVPEDVSADELPF